LKVLFLVMFREVGPYLWKRSYYPQSEQAYVTKMHKRQKAKHLLCICQKERETSLCNKNCLGHSSRKGIQYYGYQEQQIKETHTRKGPTCRGWPKSGYPGSPSKEKSISSKSSSSLSDFNSTHKQLDRH
jgi:hypothetical protein